MESNHYNKLLKHCWAKGENVVENLSFFLLPKVDQKIDKYIAKKKS